MITAIYCAGGYGREIYDNLTHALNFSSNHKIIFIDDFLGASGIECDGKIIPIYSFESKDYEPNQCLFVISSGEPSLRNLLYKKIINNDLCFKKVIDSSAFIAASANIGDGVIIGAFSSVQNRVSIEDNVSINTGSVIGHDARIKKHSVISSQANIGGAAQIGECTYIGMGTLIREGVKIGANSIVGMGSVVFNDLPEGVVALGNPARIVRKNVHQRVFK
jgi:sugar O-acyltransferase (sialic acid O-acetyltransferase NeuD family)